MRKAKNANKSFLTGTAFLAIGVIALVVLFTVQAFRLSANKEEMMRQDIYTFVLADEFAGETVSLWLGDSLIAKGMQVGDTVRHRRLSEESSVLVADSVSGSVTVMPVSVRSGLVTIRKNSPR